MEHLEKEIKILANVQRQRLEDAGAKFDRTANIEDTYYMSLYSEEKVRLRKEGGRFELTYKSKNGGRNGTKSRVETTIELQEPIPPEMAYALGLKRMFVVHKRRQYYRLGDMIIHTEEVGYEKGGQVVNFGHIFEVEYASKRDMMGLLRKIGFDEGSFEKNSTYKLIKMQLGL